MLRLVLALTMLAAPVAAEPAMDLSPSRLSFLVASHHVNTSYDFEEINPGLFLAWDGSSLPLAGVDLEVDWIVGAYRNSYGRSSVALLAEVPLAEWDGGGASILVGAVRYPEDAASYPVHIGEWLPFGALQVRQGWLNAQVVPGDGVTNDAALRWV